MPLKSQELFHYCESHSCAFPQLKATEAVMRLAEFLTIYSYPRERQPHTFTKTINMVCPEGGPMPACQVLINVHGM